MIIIEGADGSGKSTLLKCLVKDTGLPAHERASDSVKGPLDDLYGWTEKDVTTWHKQPLSIYDRHPLVSEHIYGRYVRNNLRPGFEMTNEKLGYMRKHLRQNALVIVCLPPFRVVQENVADEAIAFQMPGVVENIQHIYDVYQMIPVMWPLDSHVCTYDYTVPDTAPHGYTEILAAVKHHMSTWRGAKYE